MHLMRRAAAAHHLDATGAEEPLPEGLIEVHGLDASQWYLGHLDVEDAVLLHEAGVRDSKLAARTNDAAHDPYKESQHKQSDACVEELGLVLRITVVSQPNDKDSAHSKQQAEEQILEDVRPVEPALEDDSFAFFEALLDVICHINIG